MAEQDIGKLDDKDREILLLVALGLSYDIRVFNERLTQENVLEEMVLVNNRLYELSKPISPTKEEFLENYGTQLTEELLVELIKRFGGMEKWGES